MPAYWIAHVKVTDEARYGRYAKLAPGTDRRARRPLPRPGRPHEQLEGNDRARNVMIEFPDLASAEACYNVARLPRRAALRPRLRPSASS